MGDREWSEVPGRLGEVLLVVPDDDGDGVPILPLPPQVLHIWLRESRMWEWLLLTCQVAAWTENRKKTALCLC